MTKILDCTTRDGGHITNWNFDDDFVFNHMKFLNDNKVTYYEIGYRNHFDIDGKGRFYKCSPDFLEKFFKNKRNLQIGVMTDTKRFSEEDFLDAQNDFVDFVRIACHPDKIDETLKFAEILHERNYKIFVQLMDISNVDANGFIKLFEWMNKNVLESLYFADSYGTITPQDVENYYNKLKILGYDKISFHGHNNSGLALENSLNAVELGAYSIDTTLEGMGRCGGNLDLKILLEKLR